MNSHVNKNEDHNVLKKRCDWYLKYSFLASFSLSKKNFGLFTLTFLLLFSVTVNIVLINAYYCKFIFPIIISYAKVNVIFTDA